MNSVIFPSSESFNGKDTWISQKTPHIGIKNNVLFIYEADFFLCADFIISLSLVSQIRTNSWFLTRCFHRGFILFSPGNYQSISTGKNQTMLPYFWFLTHADWRGAVHFGRVEKRKPHNFLVYVIPSSFTGFPSAGTRNIETRYYQWSIRLPMMCTGLQLNRKPTVQDSTRSYDCYVFNHGFCITTTFSTAKVKQFIHFSLALPKF